MTNAEDNTILTLLKALDPPLRVFDGHVEDSDEADKVVKATLPYVVFYGRPDDDAPGDSMAGSAGAHLTEFQITFVGETREQAKLAGERARGALNRKMVTFPAGARFVRATDDRQYVSRDDTWTRPGGKPLFFGVDRYAVLI